MRIASLIRQRKVEKEREKEGDKKNNAVESYFQAEFDCYE